MSSTSAPSPAEFDFWEHVVCAKCQLSFQSHSGVPTVPFWLTECGHVVCNSHLNADQSCAQCTAAGIQLIPLQRDMDAPMSEWFSSVPYTLDRVAYAAKFQQETLAAKIRHCESKLQQQSVYIDRLKRENTQLSKSNETLRVQNNQFREHFEHRNRPEHSRGTQNHEPSDSTNVYGKRQMVYQQGQDDRRPGTNSSPREIVTPLGPDRLTIPPGQQPPVLSSNRHGQGNQESSSHDPEDKIHGLHRPQQRPGSNRFVQQYAYAPPSTSPMHPPRLSHSQASTRTFQRADADQNQPGQTQIQRTMLPPSLPNQKFKPAQGRPSLAQQPRSNAPSLKPGQPQATGGNMRRMAMGPPPTPPPRHQSSSFANRPQSRQVDGALSSNRFLAPSIHNDNKRFAPPGTPQGNRFVPSTAAPSSQQFATGMSTEFNTMTSGSGSRAPSRTAVFKGGGQRMPFIPGSQDGFG